MTENLFWFIYLLAVEAAFSPPSPERSGRSGFLLEAAHEATANDRPRVQYRLPSPPLRRQEGVDDTIQ